MEPPKSATHPQRAQSSEPSPACYSDAPQGPCGPSCSSWKLTWSCLPLTLKGTVKPGGQSSRQMVPSPQLPSVAPAVHIPPPAQMGPVLLLCSVCYGRQSWDSGKAAGTRSDATPLPTQLLLTTRLSPLHRGLHLNGHLRQTHPLSPPGLLASFLPSKVTPKLRMTNNRVRLLDLALKKP